MLRILDRYILREIGPSFVLGAGVFTFVLLLNEILRFAEILINQGASPSHVLGILVNLLPSVLCLTIPMGVLLGILIALGRMAADSEVTALRAGGVSLYRMLRPIIVAAAIGWMASSYMIIFVLPDSNQAVRQLLFQVLTSKVRTDIRPRVFYDNLFPNLMFLVMDMPTGTDIWQNVLLADLSTPDSTRITLARQGQLTIDAETRTVGFHLRNGEMHHVPYGRPGNYDLQAFAETHLPLNADSFFPADDVDVPRGPREMSIRQLYRSYQQSRLPLYLVEIHKKFSIPFASFVFGVLGLAFGIHNRREGRSWGFVVSIAIIFIYWILMRLGEGMGSQGRLPPVVAMWSVNILLGIMGMGLLVRNAREAQSIRSSLAGMVGSAFRRVSHLTSRRSAGSPRKPPHRPVVIIRIPRFRFRPRFTFTYMYTFRFPNTLDRYIAREFLRLFLLILTALVAVYELGVLIDILEAVFEHNTKGKLVFQYVASHFPQILFHMLPLSTLMATLVNFAILTKNSEINAIKAGGISLYRISLPIVMAGIMVSLLCFALQEYILPYSNRSAEQLEDEIKERASQTRNLLDRRWMMGQNDQIYHYTYYDPGRKLFNGLAVYRFDKASFSLTQRLYANQAGWDPASGAWIFRKGWTRNFQEQANIQRFDELSVRNMELPEYFVKEEKESDQMTFYELSRYMRDLSQSGFDVVRFEVALHSKIAFPLAALITAIIGIPFSFTPGKKGTLYGIGIAIAIGLSYYVTTRVFAYMGNSAMLPPLMAAWAPNVLFGVGALYGLFNVKT